MNKTIMAGILSLGLCAGYAGAASAMSLAGGIAQSQPAITILQVKMHGCASIADPHKRHTCEMQMSRGRHGTHAGRAKGQHP
jgi:hypothetical protein